eukprot:NODE_3257_length_795_cov_120.186327_g2719_i0.p4 GENE.NODE_3257_length_795_cov_120.186327_g2719_i0~~NODE_3257_length_795_cov_120.186327_g2719_i0.p4  ORF type:complete len:111 (+),score=26.25 NODE_3257_length_795_cov_120.186327_g2719_i0:268-600(+)
MAARQRRAKEAAAKVPKGGKAKAKETTRAASSAATDQLTHPSAAHTGQVPHLPQPRRASVANSRLPSLATEVQPGPAAARSSNPDLPPVGPMTRADVKRRSVSIVQQAAV